MPAWPRSTDNNNNGQDMGRGATAGWVKCPLCPPRRMKRYARGRGLTAHLEAVHGSASLQEKTSAIARAETALRIGG